MSTSMININGEVRDVSGLTLPTDRRFRAAWKFDGESVVVDAALSEPIMRELVNEERERRKVLPVNAVITGDVVEHFPNGDPDETHVDGGSGMIISMDMRDGDDRINLLGLTTKGSLLLSAQSADLTKVYTADDKVYKLTATQLIQLGLQSGNHDGYVYEKAKILKTMDPIPADFATNESYWTD